ncbi:MAG TPA: FkbM family methyltransferase [Methylocella sp.]|nr:FkbM family methyltransferase [Methylocella sp.]
MKRKGQKFIRTQLERLGIAIERRKAGNGPSIPLLRLLVEHSILVDGKGAILQIGANDGVLADPIHEMIVALDLPAVLVEPIPDRFEELQRNYAGQPNISFENCAVSSEPGEAELFRINPKATHFPDWAHGLASFEKTVLLKHQSKEGMAGSNLDQHIESLRVPVVTIGQLLKKHSALQKLTAIQIDTEGHDFAVVKSAVAAGCLPRIIHYEHKHLSYDDQLACRNLLISHGYSFLSNFEDTLAYRYQ